jgi:hypothetical protein
MPWMIVVMSDMRISMVAYSLGFVKYKRLSTLLQGSSIKSTSGFFSFITLSFDTPFITRNLKASFCQHALEPHLPSRRRMVAG